MNSKDRKMCDEIWSPKHGPRKLLDVIACFHHVARMDEPYSEHVGFMCTCQPFWKFGICKHAVAFTVLTDKNFSLPAELDERKLEKHDNARTAARTFAIGQRIKDIERRKRAMMTSDEDEGDEELDEEVPRPKVTSSQSTGERQKKVLSPSPQSGHNVSRLVFVGRWCQGHIFATSAYGVIRHRV
jgi:hypothetical protein